MAGQLRFELIPLGDTAVEVQWLELPEKALINVNSAAVRLFEQKQQPGVIAAVPGFVSLTIHYDPLAWNSWEDLHRGLRNALSVIDPETHLQGQTVEVPVCYAENCALDLEAVIAFSGLTSLEIIRRHCEAEYTVRMLGFMPGFPYLSGLPEELQVPRMERPRLSVPAGSVAIAGNQAGIYPVASPGGWQILGRTPLQLFDPQRESPALLRPGDRVRFRQISPAEYLEIERAAK